MIAHIDKNKLKQLGIRVNDAKSEPLNSPGINQTSASKESIRGYDRMWSERKSLAKPLVNQYFSFYNCNVAQCAKI